MYICIYGGQRKVVAFPRHAARLSCVQAHPALRPGVIDRHTWWAAVHHQGEAPALKCAVVPTHLLLGCSEAVEFNLRR